MTDRLRALWDFDDLDETERRFRERLAAEPEDNGRAEVLTQLARVRGLQGDFEDGERLVQEAEALAGSSERAAVRIDLERGRILRSGGDPESAFPLFVAAYERGREVDELYLAGDAAHMAALAAGSRDGMREWTERGIALADVGDGAARYWIGPLLNNLGWDQYEAGEFEQAHETFERALRAREADPENEAGTALARYALAKALLKLDRHAEAAHELELAVAWTKAVDAPDGWFHEALAESYAALGRASEARENAGLAVPLLLEMDPSFEGDEERARRLLELSEPQA